MSRSVQWVLSPEDNRSHAVASSGLGGAVVAVCGRELPDWADTAPRPHDGVMCRPCGASLLHSVVVPAAFSAPDLGPPTSF